MDGRTKHKMDHLEGATHLAAFIRDDFIEVEDVDQGVVLDACATAGYLLVRDEKGIATEAYQEAVKKEVVG